MRYIRARTIQMDVELAEFEAFARVVEAGSMTRAAAELGVPRATVGRRLERLERVLGVRLIRRTTRRLALTDAGRDLYAHAVRVLDAARDAERAVRHAGEAVRGDLRVSVPPIPNLGFRAMLCAFLARYPEVRLQVHFGTQVVDLLASGYDVALRASAELAPGLVGRTLARMQAIAVASPAYLERRGTPRSADDLQGHDCVVGFERGEVPASSWPLRDGRRVRVRGGLTTNDIDLQVEAALAGRGVALLPAERVRAALSEGTLLPVLADEVGTDVQVAVVYAERAYVSPAVRAFVDAVVEWARAEGGLT